MSTKLFIDAISSLFSQNKGGYMMCVCVGGGDRTPFFDKLIQKTTINRVK